MSHKKLSINYVTYDRKRKNKGSTFISSLQIFGKFHRSGLLPSNSKPDANGKSTNAKFHLTLPTSRICYRCGKRKHPIDQKCSAIDATCNKCGKKGHYAVISQKGKGHSHSSKSAHIVETTNSISTEPDYYMECREPVYMQSHMLKTAYSQHQKIPEKSTLKIEFLIGLHYKDLNRKTMLKVDTGSEINCISLGTFQRLFPHQSLTKSTLLLKNYGNSPVSIIGKFKAFVHWKGKIFCQEFHVTNANSSPNLLSRDASFQMKVLQTCFAATRREFSPRTKQSNHYIESNVSQSTLNIPTITPTSVSQSPLTKEKILEVYADIFDGLGTFPGEPYKFRLKENYVPARHAPRKVLIHLQDDFHAEIHNLVKQGVLEKVEHSTEWVNSFVIVEKDISVNSGNTQTPNHKFKKKLQICLDPRDLNEALKWEPYYS